MTRMNSRKIKLRKGMTDSKASEVFTKMLEKNNKNINNTNKHRNIEQDEIQNKFKFPNSETSKISLKVCFC